LRDTIALKQNNANIYEAHESRRESEAVLVFTLVSSFMLPLSFFTSIFSMSVREVDGVSNITLAQAMTYIGELSPFDRQHEIGFY
jgi:Mg2+ and Co2+ transporter CorA